MQKVQTAPESYDQPILYTYGDELSLRHYGAMGFKKLSEQTYTYAGKKWWVLVVSPKVLEQRLQVISNLTEVRPKQDLKFRAGPRGMPITVAAGSQTKFYEFGNGPGGRTFIQSATALAEETEVSPGVWAAKETGISWTNDGDLTVQFISRPVQLPLKAHFWLFSLQFLS